MTVMLVLVAVGVIAVGVHYVMKQRDPRELEGFVNRMQQASRRRRDKR